MSSGIDCGKLEEVLESIFQIPVDAARLDKWVNGGEFETVMLGGREVPTLRNLVRQIDERSSQAAEEEINEAKAEIGALAAKIQAKIDELKAMTASAETLPPDHPATVYYNAGTGEFEFGIPQGKQGIQGERGLAPAIDIIYGGDPSDEGLSIIYGGNPALDEPGDRTIIRQVARIGTSAQWATANPVLEDGESGYERTPEGKLLWKTGDGVTHWNDLPYPSILVDRIYRYRGSVATVEDLPANAQEGDVYNITSTGANYAWTGTQWDNLGVVQEIDPAPVKGSGNPVASGGVYAALEDMQTDIAATGAPDDVTIIKDESGKLVAQDIAIGGDPTDLASARGYIVDELLPWYPGYFDTPLADFDAATILGRYHVAVHKETTLNAPPILLFSTNTLSNDGMLIVEAMSSATGISSVRRYRQTFMVFGSASKIWVRHQGTSGEWGTWREIIADTNIGDGIRVTNGMLSVPEYEGATATEPGTAGLVPPATVEEKDKYLKGDGTYGSGLAASVFTPPTESAPGTAGLVPAPQPIAPVQQPLKLLGANALFNTLTAGSFDISWERANSTNIVLGAVHMGSSMAIASINVAGTYYSDNWTDAPFPGAGLYELRELFPYGTDGGARVNFAWFFSIAGKRMYIRGATGSRAAGTPFMWTEWAELLDGRADKAPMPHAPDGMAGSWQLVIARASDPYLRIPAGGSWAVYSGAIWVDGAMDTDGYASVFAGGTVIGPLILYSSARQSALCYMVQNSSTKHSITNDEWQARDIVRRADGSYVIRVHELPYHVPNEDAYANLWIEVDTYAQAHPEQVTEEPAPHVPTEEELLARAKTLKTSEFDRAMADIDAKLARSTSDLVAAMLTPATLAAETDAALLSADELEKSKVIFVTLRQVQAQNRVLREQVQTAQSVEEVQAVEPVIPDMAALAARE